ncbi:hypothetical protein PMIN06_002285 [Paraphaeosphaeria minitans]|uniref:C6 transcription factor (Fungal specific transcription factor) n=1 Tax=Paraphaeosphaeria minitans TaxID=565426 RepID=A0A9P6GNW9_9PLEO|nr:C6 transcription factor (fungal specific transcription factor) [Paraphaeosphaeria minitans]
MAEPDSLRNPRLRLSCARCQRRKIRCDAQLPACTNCRKAGAECTDGESLRLRSVPDDPAVSRLRRRVAWLESIIRETLPDIDLSVEAPIEGSVPPEERTVIPLSHGDQPSVSVDNMTALPLQAVAQNDQRAHEIGLISVGTADQRYLGPSSGYFLARLLLSDSPRRNDRRAPVNHNAANATNLAQSLIYQLVCATPGPLPLPGRAQANELSRIYFDTVHPQYPILHEPSFMQGMNYLYDSHAQTLENDAPVEFQVNMVLAIATSILSSRVRSHVPSESYCLSALQHLERINVQNSFSGLQCILLLLIFTMHSPYMRLNVWYLNYHCIAAVLELGLQRDVTTSSGISLLDQEMRTRVFWTIFTLDRTIATMMGRPIGLRDEACDLRLPQDIDDQTLIGMDNADNYATGNMALSIHLFKLAKINSEIKYIANSIVREAPSYAYPPVSDINTWHRGMLAQLDEWASTIPQIHPRHAYVRTLCELRYYSIRILLLRPSPAIPRPSAESLTECYGLAWRAIHVYDKLYRQDQLVHDWMVLHGIIFSTITALYCIRAVPDLARKTELDELMTNLSLSLSLVSVTGEYWSGAKRSRQILDDMGRSTIRWMKYLKMNNSDDPRINGPPSEPAQVPPYPNITESAAIDATLGGNYQGFTSTNTFVDTSSSTLSLEDGFWADPPQQFTFGDITNVDDIMHSLFDDFIPQMNNMQE